MKWWRVRKMGLSLAGGVVVTVLVAAGLRYWVEIPREGQITLGPVAWPRPVPAEWPREASMRTSLSRGPVSAERWMALGERSVFWTEYRYGWPFPALILVDQWWDVGAGAQRAHTGICFDQTTPPIGVGRQWIYPKTPIWPGFALNCVLYGAMVYGLWSTPGAVRRALRRQRGECAWCGYDLRGLPQKFCPECGR
jgi:hypothetical protein